MTPDDVAPVSNRASSAPPASFQTVCPCLATVLRRGATATPTARFAPLHGGVGLAGPVFRYRKNLRETAGRQSCSSTGQPALHFFAWLGARRPHSRPLQRPADGRRATTPHKKMHAGCLCGEWDCLPPCRSAIARAIQPFSRRCPAPAGIVSQKIGGSAGTRTRTWHLKRVLRCRYATLPIYRLLG